MLDIKPYIQILFKQVKFNSAIVNKHTNKRYIISTVPFRVTRSISYYGSKRRVNLLAQSAIFLQRTNFFSSLFTYFNPVIFINLGSHSGLLQTELHNIVCNLVLNEQIENIGSEDIYGKAGFLAACEESFNPWALKKKPVVTILSKF